METMPYLKYVCPDCGYEAKVAGSCPCCDKPLVASCPTCGNPVVGEHVQSNESVSPLAAEVMDG